MSKGVQSDIVIFLDAFIGFPGQFVADGGCFHHVNEISFFFLVLSVIKLFWQHFRVCCVVLGFVSGFFFFSVLEHISCFSYFL